MGYSREEPSEVDFATDVSMIEPQQTVINRKVAKAPKKKSVTMKRQRSESVAKKSSREALKDRTNIKDTDGDSGAPKPKGKKATSQAQEENEEPKAKKARTTSASANNAAPRKPAKSAPAKKMASSPAPEQFIPETQPVEDISETVEADESLAVDEPEPIRKTSHSRSGSQQRQTSAYTAPPRARSNSIQPRTFSREGSATLAERRLADTETRRKLVDMTSRYEDMRLRYESLSELGNSVAESNFDKLKRATDERNKDAADLISSLKKDVSEARKTGSSHTADNARLQTQIEKLQGSNEQAQASVKEMKGLFADAQNEIKSLTAKLDAARKAASSAAVEAAKAPSSPIRSRDTAPRAALTSGNLDSAKQAALKEELYRDLTGLIINSIKRKDGEDEYSCIQTGRNGTLHFHLTINNDSTQTNPKTPSGLSYEDAEFAYEPFFDEGRDRDLIDILPDYLTEEICFPRNHAVKFYTKVVDSMTKRVVIEE